MRKLLLAATLAILPLSLGAQELPRAAPTLGDTREFPDPKMVEGQPFEMRPPEKADDAPLFKEQTRAPYHHAADFQVTTLTDKLHLPWAIAFLSGGKMLVTEKFPGHLRIVNADGSFGEPLTGIDMLAPAKKLGLLDVALAPDFAKSRRIYFTFFALMADRNGNTNLASGILDEAAGAVHGVTVLFRGKPYESVKNFSSKQGGRIAFAKDGSIFLSMGDRDGNIKADYDLALAQKLDNHMGKVLHLTPEGLPASDNPFLKMPGALPEIWTYGMRNPQGLAFDPRTGHLWETEHGPRGGDELNRIDRGKNYGWPIITHGKDYGGGPIGEGIVAKPGLEQPQYYWDPVIAPSSLAFYRGTLFPKWKNSLFVGALRGLGIYRLEMKADKIVAEEPMLTDMKTRLRDVRVGPDGAVYVLTEQKALLKITPR
ncbi:MAG: glucose sorbosone dehydrogenase [Alphaproteobacteria bacterium]|nr:glucose sorbosone dehydrogenase [Alphaproteobacteria bacterium]